MGFPLVKAMARDGAVARAALSSGERETCARLVGARRRRDYRAGRLAGKRAAARALGGRPGPGIEVISTSDGSPRLVMVDARGRRQPADARISISHRDGCAVAAVAPEGTRVGVDLERMGSLDRTAARYFLTEAERASDVTALWSLKEAAWKALGLGRSVPFKELELRTGGVAGVRAVRLGGVSIPVSASLTSPWRGYLLATVWIAGGRA